MQAVLRRCRVHSFTCAPQPRTRPERTPRRRSPPLIPPPRRPQPRLLSRLRDVAAGMAYLHSRGVLHGDLKAANVLLQRSARAPFGAVAKVADFGLSRIMAEGQTHRSTTAMGTITHMPPELLCDGKLSPAADVYSFGVVMWWAAAGGGGGGGRAAARVNQFLGRASPRVACGCPWRAAARGKGFEGMARTSAAGYPPFRRAAKHHPHTARAHTHLPHPHTSSPPLQGGVVRHERVQGTAHWPGADPPGRRGAVLSPRKRPRRSCGQHHGAHAGASSSPTHPSPPDPLSPPPAPRSWSA
ncbi:MAG: kinase-like domain-containing protein [Monoraphidium minutum]|nr:MAG: kinase-like domain-containing protein [Monoraphidium minutum]